VKDKFRLSWQIVPTRLLALMTDPDAAKARRALQAMLTIKRIDIRCGRARGGGRTCHLTRTLGGGRRTCPETLGAGGALRLAERAAPTVSMTADAVRVRR
jgi:hypothetical protein